MVWIQINGVKDARRVSLNLNPSFAKKLRHVREQEIPSVWNRTRVRDVPRAESTVSLPPYSATRQGWVPFRFAGYAASGLGWNTVSVGSHADQRSRGFARGSVIDGHRPIGDETPLPPVSNPVP
ncbi:hypothetical protein BHE74_00026415 [Ensete ventricosum]|nr:hypothetical protein BHE74_00026415 [Ensete ventricosum]